MRTILTFLVTAGLASLCFSFLPEKPMPATSKIEWLTMEEAYARNKKEPRKFLVDVYTDWCHWCKVMDKETYTDPKVAEYVNKKFYAVRFNAESRSTIRLGPHTFKFIPQGAKGFNQLAAIMLDGQMSYPSTVFIDEIFMDGKELAVIQAVPGYLKAREFHQVATFFGENYHEQETEWETYKDEIYPKVYGK